jgi:methyl-accepting chemotaxis protein
MSIQASTSFSQESDSDAAGRSVGSAVRREFGTEPLRAVLVYATVNHDLEELLASIRKEIGPDVELVGCSAQGVVSNDQLTEEGFAVGVMGFGGNALSVSTSVAHDVECDPFEKGKRLAAELKARIGREPRLVVLAYDPLCGVDVEALLRGAQAELPCPIVGGAAGQPWGPPVRTYQCSGDAVFSRGAVALALAGPFDAQIGICHGTVPTGLTITVTKTDGNRILEIDGRRAHDVWCEQTGLDPKAGAVIHQDWAASWAIGVERRYQVQGPNGPSEEVVRMIRGAFGVDSQQGSIILQAAVPEGSKVMFHHREISQVLAGTKGMGLDLASRLHGKTPWAVLGFECAARTFPFLGAANTLEQHRGLRKTVAPDTAWLGMMAWGEVAPLGGQPAFHNYTYPLTVLTR